ncbi:MAG: hypothetical protein WBN96_08575 [Gammaproteobacteria bacterium]
MKHLYVSLLFVFAINLPALADESVDAPAAESSDAVKAIEAFKFPPWPEAEAADMPESDFVPPPPGPYMSNALSVVGSGFDSGPAPQLEPTDSVFFKPDMAWPERRFAQPPERWMPKDGYHYVPEDAVRQTPLARHYNQPYGYSGAPRYMQPAYGWGPAQPRLDGRYAQPPRSGY